MQSPFMVTPQEFPWLALIFMGRGHDAIEVKSPTQGLNFANALSLLKSNVE